MLAFSIEGFFFQKVTNLVLKNEKFYGYISVFSRYKSWEWLLGVTSVFRPLQHSAILNEASGFFIWNPF